jgi:dihydrofolate reductase
MKYFRKITTGHAVIMGRRTYLSLPVRPLRNRENIVITDDPSDVFEGCTLVYSIQEALDKCKPEDENFIIGGASVYEQFLPFTDRLYITWIHKEFEGDVYFPTTDLKEWIIISQDDFPFDDNLGFGYSYVVYDRMKI